MQKDVHTMDAISNTQNQVHSAQQKVKEQQRALRDTWKKLNWIIFLIQYTVLHQIFNATW
jgi:hypothetical protein